MCRTHHVGRVGADRIDVRPPHQRLCGEMEHHLRTRPRHHGIDRRGVAHVTELRIDPPLDGRQREEVGRGRGRKRKARDAGPQPAEPETEPGALEARVPGDEDASVAPEIASARSPRLPRRASGPPELFELALVA